MSFYSKNCIVEFIVESTFLLFKRCNLLKTVYCFNIPIYISCNFQYVSIVGIYIDIHMSKNIFLTLICYFTVNN